MLRRSWSCPKACSYSVPMLTWAEGYDRRRLTKAEKHASLILSYYSSMPLGQRLSSPSWPWLYSHLGRPDQIRLDTLDNLGLTSCSCHMLVASHRTVTGQWCCKRVRQARCNPLTLNGLYARKCHKDSGNGTTQKKLATRTLIRRLLHMPHPRLGLPV
jgi:hypothetical protein